MPVISLLQVTGKSGLSEDKVTYRLILQSLSRDCRIDTTTSAIASTETGQRSVRTRTPTPAKVTAAQEQLCSSRTLLPSLENAPPTSSYSSPHPPSPHLTYDIPDTPRGSHFAPSPSPSAEYRSESTRAWRETPGFSTPAPPLNDLQTTLPITHQLDTPSPTIERSTSPPLLGCPAPPPSVEVALPQTGWKQPLPQTNDCVMTNRQASLIVNGSGKTLASGKKRKRQSDSGEHTYGQKGRHRENDLELSTIAERFAQAICLGGQVSQGDDRRAFCPVRPKRSHSTLQELLVAQAAYTNTLTSELTISEMVYAWCLIAHAHRSRTTFSGTGPARKAQARLRKAGGLVIRIIDHLYASLRIRFPDDESVALNAYKVCAAMTCKKLSLIRTMTSIDIGQGHPHWTMAFCHVGGSMMISPQPGLND